MNINDRIIDIFIRGLEKRCLESKFNNLILIFGVSLVATNWIDLLSKILGHETDNYSKFIGTILIFLSIILHLNDKGPTIESERKHIVIKHPKENNSINISRYEKLINSRSNILLMLLGLLLIAIWICITSYYLIPGQEAFKIGISLILFIILLKPIYYLSALIFYLKKRKLFILNKKYNLEYGRDENIYLTSYDFKCVACDEEYAAYLAFSQEKQKYYLQCNEYSDHRYEIDISCFDKFSS